MTERIYVWDPLVRIFHWSLVLTFIVCYLTGDEENLTHAWSGYIILGLVAFRIVWGFIGSKHARFSDFITSPATAIVSMKDMMAGKAKKYIGHNPVGGWMVIALLVSLILTGLSGLQVYGLEGYGPLAGNAPLQVTSMQFSDVSNAVERRYKDDDDDEHARDHDARESDEHEGGEGEEDDWEEFWEEIHEFLANFTVLLIALHITGVIVSSVRENQNLIKAMFTGYKEE